MVGHFKESKYDISLLVVQPEGIVISDEVDEGDNKITDHVAWTFMIASRTHSSLLCSCRTWFARGN